MIRYIVFVLSILMITTTCPARDFMVEFVEEHYNETGQEYSKQPVIYHSIQVRSNAGPKLLILSGSNPDYRRWLRHYIAEDKNFMVKVPEDQNDAFISSRVFEIEVTRIHPFNGQKWAPGADGILANTSKSPIKGARILHGDRHILVLDSNTKRSNLMTSVINRMGYTAMISRDGEQALHLFRNQPEKFKMIIANHDVPGMGGEAFINNLLKIDHQIPILVETGYNNEKTKEQYLSKFSGAGTVIIKSVALDNLQTTIKQLVEPMKANG